jgi:hypothetical protein
MSLLHGTASTRPGRQINPAAYCRVTPYDTALFDNIHQPSQPAVHLGEAACG